MITMINMELLVRVLISLAAALVMSFAATPRRRYAGNTATLVM